ncbi:MAG: biotin carboxylase, partial [Bacteroidia bacterium]|nr:biotin carboxylase [Bacteroidia bacterium]
KLISYGKDREEAINRMIRAIDDYEIVGVETTLPFCKFVLQHEAFTSGNFDTHFIKHYFKPEYLSKENADEAEIAALFGAKLLGKTQKKAIVNDSASDGAVSKWKENRLN